MMFWPAALALALLGALWIAWPFLRRGTIEMDDSDGAISVFRDQLDELDRDLAQELISADQRDAAAQEIERRTLAAARHLDGGFSRSDRAPLAALALTAIAAAVALGGYVVTGQPGLPDRPLAERRTEILQRRAASGDMGARIQLMIRRTAENPESFEDWWVLATSYAEIGDNAAAADAYRHAAELEPGEPGVQAAYGEALVLANGNKVPAAARIIFETVLTETPDPRARYYVALAKAQSQDFTGALDDWLRLKEDSPADAPYMALLRRDIVNMVRFLGRDLTEVLPDATEAEIAAAGGASEGEVEEARIAELEAQLAEDPLDHTAWIELATRLARAGDNDRAASVLTRGAAHFTGAPFVQQKFDAAAATLGMDIYQPDLPPDRPEDPATTALPEAQQGASIDAMVAGLAARLAEDPAHPDKWIMLVRSYAVLGDHEKAEAAYATAKQHFAGDAAVLDMLAEGVADMIDIE